MKDKSVEELLDIMCQTLVAAHDLINARAELLRRFEVLEKELKALKLAHAVEKQIMQDNFDKCKTAAEHWKKKCDELEKVLTDIGVERDNALVAYESLKCCGNCKAWLNVNNEPICLKVNITDAGRYCNNWTTDGLTREEREK